MSAPTSNAVSFEEINVFVPPWDNESNYTVFYFANTFKDRFLSFRGVYCVAKTVAAKTAFVAEGLNHIFPYRSLNGDWLIQSQL